MQLNIELCMKYIYPNDSFWTEAQTVTQRLANDPMFLDFFEAFKTCLCINHSVSDASDVYKHSMKYIRVFHAETIDFYPAVLLGLCAPIAIGQFQDKGIDDAIIRDTLMDFAIWAREYERQNGRQGIGEVSWIFMPYAQKIFRLGRLQFELSHFDLPYLVFRHRQDGRHVALASSNWAIDEAGNVVHGHENATGITTELVRDGDVLTGYPADFERATVALRPMQIDLKEWTLVLCPGRRILNMHIPAEEPLDPQKVDDSLRQAQQFFGKMGYPADYGMCFSWLLDTHLQDIAEENSNIVLFMKRFYKLASEPAHAPSIMDRVFGFGFQREELDNYEPKSRLQKSLKAYLKQGGEVADIAGFISLEGNG